jgi:lipid-A-disaccharide synthase
VIRVKYISLVNLIMDRLVVKELIQHELTAANLQRELQLLLNDSERRAALAADYEELHNLLTQGGNASAAAAASIVTMLRAHSR